MPMKPRAPLALGDEGTFQTIPKLPYIHTVNRVGVALPELQLLGSHRKVGG